ncbi:MAG TPA: drug/metabolite exporter YedA [Anaerolineae bacterium]|nr:drug/metabolite exporter YedA [Anaerolineae bacterium]
MTQLIAALRNNFNVVLALLAVYLIWGSTYLGIRIALEGFAPYMLMGVRFIVAGSILYTVLRRRGMPAPTRAQWRASALIGALLIVGGMGSVAFAEQWIASSLVAVWVATMPLWAALFAGLFGRWPARLEWLGLGLGVIGVVLLNREGNLQAYPIGALAITIATVSWAFGSVWSRRLSLPPGLMSSATEMLIGGVLLLVMSLLFREPLPNPTLRSGLALAYLIVFGSLVAFTAYGYLLRSVRPTLATSYAYVNPIVAVALGAGLAGEPIGVIGVAAMIVILAAVGLVAMSGERK